MNAFAAIAVFAQESDQKFEAPNKWLPETAEILWGTIAFVVIVALLWKFAYPPIAKAMRGRTQRIADELEGAEKAKADADAEVADLEARAVADIGAMRTRATSELQRQVATWSADATERIVLSQLDDETLERLAEDAIAKIGASR